MFRFYPHIFQCVDTLKGLLFQAKEVVTFEDLQNTLGQASRATTFRYLRRVAYLRSYNRNGRYYTRRNPALFDRFDVECNPPSAPAADQMCLRKINMVRVIRPKPVGVVA